VTGDFIDHFAIVSPPESCLERLGALARLGLDKIVVGGRLGLSTDLNAAHSLTLLEQQVLPALQQ